MNIKYCISIIVLTMGLSSVASADSTTCSQVKTNMCIEQCNTKAQNKNIEAAKNGEQIKYTAEGGCTAGQCTCNID